METKNPKSYKQGFTLFTKEDSSWRFGQLSASPMYLYGAGTIIAVKSKVDSKTFYINKNPQPLKAESIKSDFLVFLKNNKLEAILSFMGNFNQ
ncbi:MAG: hypothetical protein KGO96_06960 [Elusimicrobia bacterium]|nr:hypothetical protein [Elusimicrobiota bacterium]